MYVQDLNEGLTEDKAEDDKEFDFEGGSGADPVGAGWGMDDLDSMLLKGMKKKRQQRTAAAVALIVVAMGLGLLLGESVAGPGPPPPLPPPQKCMHFPTPRNGTAQCSDLANDISCDSCENPGSNPLSRDCHIGCTCIALCQAKGTHAKEQDDGGDGLYAQHCQPDGQWSEAYTSPDTACIDTDECLSQPCKNHAQCYAVPPVAADTYHCECKPGTSGPDCEEDVDECGIPPNPWGQGGTDPCQNGGTCYESQNNPGNTKAAGFPLPAGWDDIDYGKYRCDCSTSSMAGHQGPLNGENCEVSTNQCLQMSPCQNGGTCTDTSDNYLNYRCTCGGGFQGSVCQESTADRYDTVEESHSTLQATDTGEEIAADGSVDLTDADLEFMLDDTGKGMQNIGVRIQNVTMARALGYIPSNSQVGLVREAKISFKVKEVAAHNLDRLQVQIDVLYVPDAPELSDAAYGISNPQSGSYYPGAAPGAQGSAGQIIWDVDAAHQEGQIIDTPDLSPLINPLTSQNTWVNDPSHGGSIMFKFTSMTCNDSPWATGSPCNNDRSWKGVRVFEGFAGGYPKLTYTRCKDNPCRLTNAHKEEVKTCPLDTFTLRHAKKSPSCTYNAAPIAIASQTALNESTACRVKCCDGFRPQEGKSVDYTCASSGSWEDTDGDAPDVSCVPLEECASSPCANGGSCAEAQPDDSTKDDEGCPTVTKTNGHGFTCTCAEGWSGDMCQADKDDCAVDPPPCHHDGDCQDAAPGADAPFTCNCKPGYSGDACATDIDECESSPCQNGGTCHDSSSKTDNDIAADAYACTCTANFHGDSCETDENHCAGDPPPCANGGTCTSTESGADCACVKGYEGDTCDNDVDECASDPCGDHGQCGDSSSDDSIGIDAFKCTCEVTWHGETCSTQDDMCTSAPCQNGAACDSDEDSDGNAIFVCTCTAGFGGDDCSSESVCNSNDGSAPTCQHDGVCKDDPNAELKYTCDCGDSGYNGAHCETNTDDCDDGTEARNDCENGIKEDGSLDTQGTCVDAINAHTCTCHPGFSGDTCTDHKSECDAQSPCQNGGECKDDASENAGYTCTCADGFSGPTCGNGEETDDCAVDGGTPCLNGAECVDGDDDYTCKCNDGDLEGGVFAGKNCETCEDGKQPNDDHTACQNCPAGKAGIGGTCADCEDGTEQSHDHVSCVACAAGTATIVKGSGKCEACQPGSAPMEDASEGCADCVGEQYGTDGLTCQACEPGKHPHIDHTSCDDCSPGRAGDTGTCKKCKPGKMPADDKQSCIKCGGEEPNLLVSRDGSECVACEDGLTANEKQTNCTEDGH